jgi:hypothetical protein
MPSHDADILLASVDAGAPWGKTLREAARQARIETEQRLGIPLDAPPLVESAAPERVFYERLERSPHNIIAAAMAHENQILINRDRFLAADQSEQLQTLVHEFSHLVLGRQIPGGIPRWMDEGLAMIAAGEHGWTYHTRLAVAASFGSLEPLDRLWNGGLGVEGQTLAYAQSLSATRFFLRFGGYVGRGQGHDPALLVRKLSDPERGRELRDLLHDPNFIRMFERRWRESIRSVWSWAAALTGGGFLWGAMTGLFLFAYYRKRKRAREIEHRWEEEDVFDAESMD